MVSTDASLPTDAILIVQAVASGGMCGLIWFVQAVHYPLFGLIHGDPSRAFARAHQDRTARVVIPFMLAEGLTALLVAVRPPDGVPRPLAMLGVAMVAAIWLSTAVVQMPLHARLAREGHAAASVDALVRSNWLRTTLWTLRAVLAAWMLRMAA